MRMIFKGDYGSRLFGTALASSDRDIRCVALPEPRDILLGRASYARQLRDDNHKKMSAGEEDVTVTSVQKFSDLLATGDVTAIETLFAPNLLGSHPDWDRFRSVAQSAFPVNAERFRAYGKSQMLRYSTRGAGVRGLREVVAILRDHMAVSGQTNRAVAKTPRTMSLLKQLCIEDQDVSISYQEDRHDVPILHVSGRSAYLTARPFDALKIFDGALKQISARRASAAEHPDLADIKGIYHAMRIVDEGIELLQTGRLVFPLQRAPLYLKVRTGEVPLRDASRIYEERMTLLMATEAAPGLRAEADRVALEGVVADLHAEAILGMQMEFPADMEESCAPA